MNSFCIKTNNNDILDYLLKRIKEINFEELIYSKNKFKVYENVIIHYQGKDNEKFLSFLSDLITEVVLEFYEEKLIKQILNYNYFYFDEYERIEILKACMGIMEDDEKDRLKIIEKAVYEYLKENKSMILEGFVYFRLKEYVSYLDNIIDIAVNQFIIDREYTEFINLLRIYVNSKPAECDVLHLVYVNGESIILDDNENIVSVSNNILNAKYLSDISFSSNDFALNTLLTMLPERIEIHLIGIEDEFINTIKLIFENRVSLLEFTNRKTLLNWKNMV